MTVAEHIPKVEASVVGQWLSPAGILAAFASVAGLLPVIVGTLAGIAATCYYVAQTAESPRVRKWLDRRAEAKRNRKAAKLQYRQSLIVGELKALGMLTHAETHVTADHQTTQIETSTEHKS